MAIEIFYTVQGNTEKMCTPHSASLLTADMNIFITKIGIASICGDVCLDVGWFFQGVLADVAEPERVQSTTFVRGGSSSRRAVVSSSRPTGSTEAEDPARTLTNKMGPISLRTSGMQRSSPVASAEPKRTVSNHHLLPNLRHYKLP